VFDDRGECTAHMTIKEYEISEKMDFGLLQFFSGQKISDESPKTLSIGLSGFYKNPCITLSVKTPAGIFRAFQEIYYQHDVEHQTLKFSFLRSEFEVSKQIHSKYWVLPLTNFVSDFRLTFSDLNNHPLRIFSIPEVPIDASNDDLMQIGRKNKL